LFGELAGETTDWLILVGSSSDGTMEHYSTAADTHSMCVGPRKRFLGMELVRAFTTTKLPVATVRKGSERTHWQSVMAPPAPPGHVQSFHLHDSSVCYAAIAVVAI
jgi:hypothetical protein